MIKSKEEFVYHIDLTGPDGNAFYLLGKVDEIGRKVGISKTKREMIKAEMRLSDYEMLVETFHKYFKHVVVLYR